MNTCYETGQNKSNNEKKILNFTKVLFYKCCNIPKAIQNELNAQRDMKLNMLHAL